MIRKQIVFKTNREIEIDYNYNYDVMKNIYYYLTVADDVVGKRLHNEGYRSESGHIYKLFNFSLLFEDAIFDRKGIKCGENAKIKLLISGKKDIVSKILKGLLHVKKSKISGTELKLVTIEDDKRVKFNEVMLYNTLSPVVETTKDSSGKKVDLSVYESDFYKNLAENAKRKYKLIYDKEYKGNIFFDIDDALKIKEKFIKFKEGGQKGYLFDIWIEADRDMQKVIYYLGAGQSSSIGMGCLNYVTGVKGDAKDL